MTKKTFDLLIEKYLKGGCTISEKRAIEDWLDLVGSEEELEKSEEEWEAIKSEIWSAISANAPMPEIHARPLWRRYWAVAASVILVCGISFWFLDNNNFFENSALYSQNLTLKTNNTNKYIKVKLSDGSTVTLAPRASISFPNAFLKNSREVFLQGKAFFEIEKNPTRPFLVHSDNIITKVIGTSFWVEPNKNKKSIEVKVVSGKVSVYEKQDSNQVIEQKSINNGVIITPNQKVEFFESAKIFVTGIVDNPVVIHSPETSSPKVVNYKFQDTPIAEVIALYEENYGINIEVETEHLKNCPITADLNGVPYYTALEIICKTINVKYEANGTSILIIGKGCN